MNVERIRIALFILALIVLGLGSGLVAADDRDDRFGLRSLKGEWGYSAFGSIGGVPAAGVGHVTFDGNGQCVNVATLNAGGALIPLDTKLVGGSCSYTVNPNGTGRIEQTFIDPFGQPANFDITFVIVDNRKEFRFVVDNPDIPTVGNGVAKRQLGSS